MVALTHRDIVTHIDNPEDYDILNREQFNVNLRLYESSPPYRRIVNACCAYIRECAITKREGYKKPHGFSGANAGIPFRIIALINGSVLINPKITERRGHKASLSNCGSLTLPKPIKIWRSAEVDIEAISWPDMKCYSKCGYLPTHQHEIDHCDGILITDRVDRNFDDER